MHFLVEFQKRFARQVTNKVDKLKNRFIAYEDEEAQFMWQSILKREKAIQYRIRGHRYEVRLGPVRALWLPEST